MLHASNTPAPDAASFMRFNLPMANAGLINLIRRKLGLAIPGLAGEVGDMGKRFPGTTGIWFWYLQERGRLQPIDIGKSYPRGTLLLRDFADAENDQGHLAILLTDDSGDAIIHEDIIHAYAEIDYSTWSSTSSLLPNREQAMGQVGISTFYESHFQSLPDAAPIDSSVSARDEGAVTGYYTHACLPDGWLVP